MGRYGLRSRTLNNMTLSTALRLSTNRLLHKGHPRLMSISQHGNRANITLLIFLILFGLAMTGCNAGKNLGSQDKGWSPVVAADGMVYVGSVSGKVLALKDDGRSVQLMWSFPQNEDDSIGGVYNPPVVGPDLLYVSALNGTLYALDKRTGQLDGVGWSVIVGNPDDPSSLVSGAALSPDKSTVVVGSSDGNLYAYDARTGMLRSGYPFESPEDMIWSTPVIDRGVIYFGSHDNNIYAVDLASGTEKWRRETGGAVIASPLVFKNRIIVGSFDRKLYVLSEENGVPLWGDESPFPGMQTFSKANNWFWAGAVADNSTVFAANMDGNIYAIDIEGNLRWKQQLDAPIASTPVVMPTGLVVATKKGEVKRLDLSNGTVNGLPRLTSEVRAPLSSTSTVNSSSIDFSQEDQSDSVFIGTQDGLIYRLRVNSNQNQSHLWCFDSKEQIQLANSECSAFKE